ncbi:Putative phosphatidate phosphatase [Papilio machaon]|uniref:Putative phosphatidate phosphatase n=1 Tax=Papilio machaon TaxID=76193 RepID=A0A194QVF5_PAPMA|nr:Putative phosphatidate phosphatase [Papilio machaon]
MGVSWKVSPERFNESRMKFGTDVEHSLKGHKGLAKFIFAAICILLEVGALPSRRGGFICNDPALSYPHTGDTFSISFVAAVTVIVPFLVWYLQRRAFSWRSRSVLAVPLLQTLAVLYAVVCALSRLTDRRHHWWDVLAGAVMGFLTLLYTVLVLCKNFSQPSVVSTSDISSSDGNNHQSVRRLLASEPRVVVP